MTKTLVENLEKTGCDNASLSRELNIQGAKHFEHYGQNGPSAYLRETTIRWEYVVITLYGNSTNQTEAINKAAAEGWEHYLQSGVRGYFRRARAPAAPAPLPAPAVIPVAKAVMAVKQSGNGHKNGTAKRGFP